MPTVCIDPVLSLHTALHMRARFRRFGTPFAVARVAGAAPDSMYPALPKRNDTPGLAYTRRRVSSLRSASTRGMGAVCSFGCLNGLA